MKAEIMVLCFTAFSIGFLHTVFGPDHYLPFIVMAKARKWPLRKTAVVTFLCGVGHIMSSVILGAIGILVGIGVMKLEILEAFRGNLAAWALIGFGFMYFIWGIHKAIKNNPHSHFHSHSNLTAHSHYHPHSGEHAHLHKEKKGNMTPWILFTIFVLGPCEPLIPILMYPAAKSSFLGVLLVAGIFGTVTVVTMMSIVIAASRGISFIFLGKCERYVHAIAGGTICLSGLAIQFLGL